MSVAGLKTNRKNASDVWTMMTRTGPEIAMCNICGREFKCNKGTSNLLRHIKMKHDDIVKIVHEEKATGATVSVQVQDGDVDMVSPNIKPIPVTYFTPVTPTLGDDSESRVLKYRSDSRKKKNLDRKLLTMIYKDMQPFSVVEDSGFRAFCYEMDAQYELPNRRQLKQALPSVYEEKKGILISMLSKVDSVAITTDSWTSLNMQSFLTVTAHFYEPFPSWRLRSAVLATRSEDKTGSSGEGMAEIIVNSVLEEFSLKSKIVAVTTDNSSAMVNLVKDHLKVFHVRCFAHSLNEIVRDAVKSTEDFCSIVDNVKTVVNHFHKSTSATARLQSVMNDMGMQSLKLSQESPTRWNSTLKMLRRYIKLHRAVSVTLTGLARTDLSISDHSVVTMEAYCESLEAFEEATEMMSNEKRTSLSQILVVVHQLQKFLATEAVKTSLNNNLQKEISDRFRRVEESFTESAATLLDPRFKRLPFSDDFLRKKHEDKIIAMMEPFNTTRKEKDISGMDIEDHQPATKRRSLMESFVDKVKEVEKRKSPHQSGPREELKRYMGMKYLKLNGDPNLWWQENVASFPHLSAIARHFCFIPATSVPSERLFSKVGELVSKRRRCLNPSTIDMVLFLNQQ